MSQKPNHDRRDTVIVLAVLAAALLAVVLLLLPKDGKAPEKTPETKPVQTTRPTEQPTEEPIEEPTEVPTVETQPRITYEIPGFTVGDAPGLTLHPDLKLIAVGGFTGAYPEDGSDEPVTDVLGIILENVGDRWIEYTRITLELGGKEAVFEVTALPDHSAVLALEKERTLWDGSSVTGAGCTEPAYVEANLDFGADFQIYSSEGVITVQNVSGRDVSGEITLCYKEYRWGLFFGGLSCRVRLEGGLADGEMAQSVSDRFHADTSVILYMTYEE